MKYVSILFVLALLLLGISPGSCRDERPAAMTGNGSIVGTPVSYELSLHCNPDRGANTLSIAVSPESGFELVRVTQAVCRDDSTIHPGWPPTNFDSYHGEGIGRFGGEDGARAAWLFTDAGEPGNADLAELTVYGPDGDILLEISGKAGGNHQARGDALLPIEPQVDEDNVVNSVIVDQKARSRDFEQTMLSADAFGVAQQDPKPPIVETAPPKIHSDLLLRVRTEDPDTRAEVLMNLTEVKELTRFPDHPIWFGCDSPKTFEIKQETAAIIADQLNANLQATEEFLARFNEGDHDIEMLEQFWIVNAFAADVRLGDVEALAADDEVQFIEETVQDVPPPAGLDGNPNNDLIDGRALIESDRWFNQYGVNEGCIGLIDTGVDDRHRVFTIPNRNIGFRGDCALGGQTCLDSTVPGFNPLDTQNHATGTASILAGNSNLGADFRGVTDIRVDSWKVWGIVTGRPIESTTDQAIIRAFQQGFLHLNRVFAIELQQKGPASAPVSVAADNLFDSGAVVLAATGNCAILAAGGDSDCTEPVGTPSPGTVRSPGNAHKVLGVGAFNVESLITGDSQGYGPTNDERIKPDIQAPTDTETASQCAPQGTGARDCGNTPFDPMALDRFGGTSGSLPYATGAAALMRNWLRRHNTFDPGHTYARLILSGFYTYPYPARHGAGRITLPSCVESFWGRVKVPLSIGGATVVDIPIPVSSGFERFTAALWWPESLQQTHSDLDLYLIDPNMTTRASATDVGSVFERTGETNPVAGQWTLRIQGIPGKEDQVVYWAADLIGCDAISQKGNPYPPSP